MDLWSGPRVALKNCSGSKRPVRESSTSFRHASRRGFRRPQRASARGSVQPARPGGLTWYAVAKRAGTANPSTAGDIEYGRDTELASVQAVADAIGLRLELVEI